MNAPRRSPAAKAQHEAEQLLTDNPGRTLGIVTDAHSYPGRHVIVAIARPGASVVLQIPAAEYAPIELMRFAGLIDPQPTPKTHDLEQLRREHAHAKRNR